jgi:hypothetical protein
MWLGVTRRHVALPSTAQPTVLCNVPRRRLTTGQHLEHTHEARAASRICTSFRVRQSLLGRSDLADALHVAWHHLSVATGDTVLTPTVPTMTSHVLCAHACRLLD